ncbi:unnamed protein product, partial [Trichogramma brassicae]
MPLARAISFFELHLRISYGVNLIQKNDQPIERQQQNQDMEVENIQEEGEGRHDMLVDATEMNHGGGKRISFVSNDDATSPTPSKKIRLCGGGGGASGALKTTASSSNIISSSTTTVFCSKYFIYNRLRIQSVCDFLQEEMVEQGGGDQGGGALQSSDSSTQSNETVTVSEPHDRNCLPILHHHAHGRADPDESHGVSLACCTHTSQTIFVEHHPLPYAATMLGPTCELRLSSLFASRTECTRSNVTIAQVRVFVFNIPIYAHRIEYAFKFTSYTIELSRASPAHDKARVKIGLTAANKQSSRLMHLDYRVKLPDHDWVIASKHTLIPSVYAGIQIKQNSSGSPENVTYSGPTYVAIRSGKHSSSTAASHSNDIRKLYELESFKPIMYDHDNQIKPVLVISVDGGPDENPSHHLGRVMLHLAHTEAPFDHRQLTLPLVKATLLYSPSYSVQYMYRGLPPLTLCNTHDIAAQQQRSHNVFVISQQQRAHLLSAAAAAAAAAAARVMLHRRICATREKKKHRNNIHHLYFFSQKTHA